MTGPGNDEDRATTEAARWLVALEDDPDDLELRGRFDAWLSVSPANADAWRNTSDVYEMMARTEPAHLAEWAPQANFHHKAGNLPASLASAHGLAATGRQSRHPSALPRRRLAFGATIVALAACLAFAVLPGAVLHLQADDMTATGELRTLYLKDGSTVHLAPDSAVSVAFADGNRQVRLLKGEAFFEVVHDPSHPFRVLAHGVQTTDIGTAFDVRLADGATAVAVQSGEVRVDDKTTATPVSEQLTSGDWARIGWSGQIQRGTLPPDEIAPWLDGQIVARDEPIAETIEELRPYYTGIIVLTDPKLGQERVTGVYNVADPASALQAIAGAHGGTVRRVSPWLLVVFGS